MSDAEEREYLLGTHDEELVRLGFQHRVWAEQASSLWERAGFGLGQTILDLGCGPGYATLDLARLVGSEGRIVAIDESARFLTYLEKRRAAHALDQIDIRRQDVRRLDVPPKSLDGAYARWLLCYLKEPAEVISGVTAALRPGGVFAVTDYFNYSAFTFAPRSEAMDRVVEAVQKSWRSHDGDLDIMLRVPSVMTECGLDVSDVEPLVHAVCPATPLWQWIRTFFDNYLPSLVEGGFLSEDRRNEFDAEWEQRANDRSTFLFTPPMLDVIGRKR